MSGIRPEVLDELRTQAAQGATPSALMAYLIARLDVRMPRVLVIAHFREAFGLEFDDAMLVGASNRFPTGTWSDAKIDDALTPLIEEARPKWMPD